MRRDGGTKTTLGATTGLSFTKQGTIDSTLSLFGTRDNGVIGSECGAVVLGGGVGGDPALVFGISTRARTKTGSMA